MAGSGGRVDSISRSKKQGRRYRSPQLLLSAVVITGLVVIGLVYNESESEKTEARYLTYLSDVVLEY